MTRLAGLLSVEEFTSLLPGRAEAPGARTAAGGLRRSTRPRHGPPDIRFEWLAAASLTGTLPATTGAAWDELAADAMEPNVFYERWMLLPALRAHGDPLRTGLLLAWDETRPGQLAGLFPLERVARFRGLPLPHLRLWRHKHCYLGTPLLRGDRAAATLAALFRWQAAGQATTALLEWELIGADGPFHAALLAALRAAGLPAFEAHSHTRAVLRRCASAQAFLSLTLTGKAQRELRRMRRRLAAMGELRSEVLDGPQDAARWIDDFLALEARGWKGRRGSALACDPGGRQFFTAAALAAAREGRLLLMRLTLDGRPIAMKCNLLAGDGAYAFKIAYDEDLARHSPGLLLEVDHVHEFHRRPGLQWLDWCAEPGHFMANRLSQARRRLVSLVSATPSAGSRLAVRCLPALRWCARQLRRGTAAVPA